MGAQFGKLYTDAADIMLAADGMTLNALRLAVWQMRCAQDGNQLNGDDRKALDGWIAESGAICGAGNVQVARFSLSSAAAVFGGSKTEAKRQVSRLIECGILSKVGTPSRGHAQLYVICPDRYTSKCAPDAGNQTNEYTPTCALNAIGCTLSGNGYTSEEERVHISGDLGTHPDAVSRDVISSSDYQTISSDGGSGAAARDAAPPPRCPRCHSENDVRLERGGLLTCSCGFAWRAAS